MQNSSSSRPPLIGLLGDPQKMLTAIESTLQRLALPENLVCDHICYRVASIERYQELKTQLAGFAALAGEEIVAGRPISIFKLHQPYLWKNQRIECIELPAPKASANYTEGWEHAEFVTGQSLPEFMSSHPQVSFDQKSLGKEINPEISYKLDGGYQIKFHPTHILAVLELEKSLTKETRR